MYKYEKVSVYYAHFHTIKSSKRWQQREKKSNHGNVLVQKARFSCVRAYTVWRCQPLVAVHNDKVFDVELHLINYDHLLLPYTRKWGKCDKNSIFYVKAYLICCLDQQNLNTAEFAWAG